ncbi:unnamed protein product [Oreochromis niloticus]|nr:unnamed protein product [Mustela putorius furo]
MDPAACDPSEELRDDIIFSVENLLSLWLEHPPEELRRALETRLQRLFSGLPWLLGSLSPTIQAFLQRAPHLLSATPASLPDSPDVILPGPSEPSAGRKCRSRRRRATPQPDIRTFNSPVVVSEGSLSDCVTVHSGAVFCAADDYENSSSPAQQPLSAQFPGVTPPLLSEARPCRRSKQRRKKDYVVEDTGLTPLQSFALFLGLPRSELHKLPTSSSQPRSATPPQPPVAAQPPVAQLAAPQQSPVLPASPSVQSPVLPASPSVQSPVLPASPSVQSPVLPASPSVQSPVLPASPSVQAPVLPASPSVQAPVPPVVQAPVPPVVQAPVPPVSRLLAVQVPVLPDSPVHSMQGEGFMSTQCTFQGLAAVGTVSHSRASPEAGSRSPADSGPLRIEQPPGNHFMSAWPGKSQCSVHRQSPPCQLVASMTAGLVMASAGGSVGPLRPSSPVSAGGSEGPLRPSSPVSAGGSEGPLRPSSPVSAGGSKGSVQPVAAPRSPASTPPPAAAPRSPASTRRQLQPHRPRRRLQRFRLRLPRQLQPHRPRRCLQRFRLRLPRQLQPHRPRRRLQRFRPRFLRRRLQRVRLRLPRQLQPLHSRQRQRLHLRLPRQLQPLHSRQLQRLHLRLPRRCLQPLGPRRSRLRVFTLACSRLRVFTLACSRLRVFTLACSRPVWSSLRVFTLACCRLRVFSPVWSSLRVFSPVWSSLRVFSPVWSSLRVFSPVWSSLRVFSPVWSSLRVFSPVWSSLRVFSPVWSSLRVFTFT